MYQVFAFSKPFFPPNMCAKAPTPNAIAVAGIANVCIHETISNPNLLIFCIGILNLSLCNIIFFIIKKTPK